jgi:hypothetical protein
VEGVRRFKCRNAEILIRGDKYPTVSKVNPTGDSRSWVLTHMSVLSLARQPITEGVRFVDCHSAPNLLNQYGILISPG